MKRAQTIISVVAAFGLLTLVSPVAAQQSAPTNTKLQRTDRSFSMKAAEGGREEVELGRLAQSKASSDAVKQFGQRMVDDHGNANKELMDLAASKNVQLNDKAAKKEPVVEKLNKLQGQEFDREYVKEMVKDHKKDVAEFRRMSEKAQDPTLKAWVVKTLPTLEDHLNVIQNLDKSLTAKR